MVLELIRYSVFGLVVLACGVAAGSWAIRTRRLNPFGRVGQIVRRASDPVLNPVENWIHRRGGNPQNAEGWLAAGSIVGGIVVISAANGLAGFVGNAMAASSQGSSLFRFAIVTGLEIIAIAIVIRVIGSWFGLHRYTPWARPLFFLTDWIIEPLRRFFPPIGPFDATPFVAFIVVRAVIALLR